MPNKKYKMIYVDPPWQFNDKANAGKRGASHKYDVMSLAEMILLPVEKLAANNCLLAMWWVGAMDLEASALAKAWGFRVATKTGLTWCKLTKTGKIHMGMGHYTRGNTENVLFGVKGSPQIKDKGVIQYFETIRGEHSEKPPEARELLERLVGKVQRVELFARCTTPGWDVWGNEVQSDIKLNIAKIR